MILIEPDADLPRAALPKRELSCFLAHACERVGVKGEVSVLLTTDERMRELNRTFRRKNKPTDVLSFSPAPPLHGAAKTPGGDLAISLAIARRQAESLEHTLLVEIQILILHGLLHLAGMDHELDHGKMATREGELRREYGLPGGLIQRSETASQRASPKAERASPKAAQRSGQESKQAAIRPGAPMPKKVTPADVPAPTPRTQAASSISRTRVGNGKKSAGSSSRVKAADPGAAAAAGSPAKARAR